MQLLFCWHLLYKARDCKELFSSLTAEVLKSKVLGEARAVEGRVERTVILAIHVDSKPAVNVRVTLSHLDLLLLRRILDEGKVILAIVCDRTIKVRTHIHAPRLTCEQLQVNTQFRVWEDVFEKRFITLEEIVEEVSDFYEVLLHIKITNQLGTLSNTYVCCWYGLPQGWTCLRLPLASLAFDVAKIGRDFDKNKSISK